MTEPIAAGLWTDEEAPRLIGGRRRSDGEIVFPMPRGDAAALYEALPLSRSGTLWSWTIQRFEPKRPPYAGPVPFTPFAIGYVELPELIVEARLDAEPGDLAIGMAMEIAIVPFADGRDTFAFRPVA